MATSLELAITAIRSGRKEEGRQLLNLLIQQNPNNEMAWLWMSSVVHNDEQRARCLYHVLAINPNNELARRGLQLLGIVVSDSRPVRVPRDSQPIPVQRPASEPPFEPFVPNILAQGLSQTATQPLNPAQQPVPQLPPAPAAALQPEATLERRPFRLDPKAITQELPFTPLREPFPEASRRSPSAFHPRAAAAPPANQPISGTGEPTPPVAPAPLAATPTSAASEPVDSNAPGAAGQPETKVEFEVPLPDFPPVQESVQKPPAGPSAPPEVMASSGQPVPADASVSPAAGQPAKPGPEPLQNNTSQPNIPVLTTAQLALVPIPPSGYPPATPPASPTYASPMSVQETRPSQPIWTTPATSGMPPSPPATPLPYAGLNGQVTMGMPTQFLQPQPPLAAVPVNHSSATMGMSIPMPNGQPAVDPLAALHASATMGMPAYMPAPYPVTFPQNQIYHSSTTMAMPTMTEAEARARLLASHGMAMNPDPLAALRAAVNAESNGQTYTKRSKKGTKPRKIEDDEEEGEEVNLLAVIVFGSLSVTALGGLGMLILLWVTSV